MRAGIIPGLFPFEGPPGGGNPWTPRWGDVCSGAGPLPSPEPSTMWKIVAFALGISLTSALAASDPEAMELWPGSPPGDTGSIGEETATKLSDGKTGGIT